MLVYYTVQGKCATSLLSAFQVAMCVCVIEQELRPAMGSREMARDAALARRLTSRRLLLRERGAPGTRWPCRCGTNHISCSCEE